MEIAIQAILTLIEGLLPTLTGSRTSGVIDQVISALEQVVPVITSNATDFLEPVQNIIAALQQSGNVTQAQIEALQALDAQCDAAFDAAAKSAGD